MKLEVRHYPPYRGNPDRWVVVDVHTGNCHADCRTEGDASAAVERITAARKDRRRRRREAVFAAAEQDRQRDLAARELAAARDGVSAEVPPHLRELWARESIKARAEDPHPYHAVFADGSQVDIHAPDDATAKLVARFRHPSAAYVLTPGGLMLRPDED